jgi:hypothetical protein
MPIYFDKLPPFLKKKKKARSDLHFARISLTCERLSQVRDSDGLDGLQQLDNRESD